LKVINFSDAIIGCYFTNDHHCAHPNREHTLMYVRMGEMELIDHGKRTMLRAGDCAFLRRDNLLTMEKHATEEKPFQSVVLHFTRHFLRDFYQSMDKHSLPQDVHRDRRSLVMLPANRPDITSLFQSLHPYFETDVKPSEEIVKMKMIEGLYVLLNTDKSLYASLFDFTEPWKIDLMEYMNDNYMNELSMEELARYTGRSLATFKRDFRKISELPPQKWIMHRRLEAAHELIATGKMRVTDVCYHVGFKNLSHFSKAYKTMFGMSPARTAEVQPA